MLSLLKDREKYFWSKVNKSNGCWLWIGSLNNGGYGHFRVRVGNNKRKIFKAHRVAWQLVNNKTIPENKIIMHICDVRNCVKPKHLMLGTTKENVIDCRNKGRLVVPKYNGEEHPSSVLTERMVLDIRKSYSIIGIKRTSEEFNIPYATVANIVYRKRWNHI